MNDIDAHHRRANKLHDAGKQSALDGDIIKQDKQRQAHAKQVQMLQHEPAGDADLGMG
ncbi:hypothetical protein D3C75_1384700 [compost metagenome]